MNKGHFWILFVILLLAGNMTAVGILFAKSGDPTPEVLPDYYQKAANYDQHLDEERASLALGWVATASLADAQVEVRIVDASGAPVRGATVGVTVDPLNRADRTATATLDETSPGVYRGAVADGPRGLYWVAIAADRDASHYISTVQVDRTSSAQGNGT